MIKKKYIIYNLTAQQYYCGYSTSNNFTTNPMFATHFESEEEAENKINVANGIPLGVYEIKKVFIYQ